MEFIRSVPLACVSDRAETLDEVGLNRPFDCINANQTCVSVIPRFPTRMITEKISPTSPKVTPSENQRSHHRLYFCEILVNEVLNRVVVHDTYPKYRDMFLACNHREILPPDLNSNHFINANNPTQNRNAQIKITIAFLLSLSTAFLQTNPPQISAIL